MKVPSMSFKLWFTAMLQCYILFIGYDEQTYWMKITRRVCLNMGYTRQWISRNREHDAFFLTVGKLVVFPSFSDKPRWDCALVMTTCAVKKWDMCRPFFRVILWKSCSYVQCKESSQNAVGMSAQNNFPAWWRKPIQVGMGILVISYDIHDNPMIIL